MHAGYVSFVFRQTVAIMQLIGTKHICCTNQAATHSLAAACFVDLPGLVICQLLKYLTFRDPGWWLVHFIWLYMDFFLSLCGSHTAIPLCGCMKIEKSFKSFKYLLFWFCCQPLTNLRCTKEMKHSHDFGQWVVATEGNKGWRNSQGVVYKCMYCSTNIKSGGAAEGTQSKTGSVRWRRHLCICTGVVFPGVETW